MRAAEEAIQDFGRVSRLDPDSAAALADGCAGRELFGSVARPFHRAGEEPLLLGRIQHRGSQRSPCAVALGRRLGLAFRTLLLPAVQHVVAHHRRVVRGAVDLPRVVFERLGSGNSRRLCAVSSRGPAAAGPP